MQAAVVVLLLQRQLRARNCRIFVSLHRIPFYLLQISVHKLHLGYRWIPDQCLRISCAHLQQWIGLPQPFQVDGRVIDLAQQIPVHLLEGTIWFYIGHPHIGLPCMGYHYISMIIARAGLYLRQRDAFPGFLDLSTSSCLATTYLRIAHFPQSSFQAKSLTGRPSDTQLRMFGDLMVA